MSGFMVSPTWLCPDDPSSRLLIEVVEMWHTAMPSCHHGLHSSQYESKQPLLPLTRFRQASSHSVEKVDSTHPNRRHDHCCPTPQSSKLKGKTPRNSSSSQTGGWP